MDIHDLFTDEQFELLNKLEILNKTHLLRWVVGREFELTMAEGKTYQETAEMLGNRIWDILGEKRCIGIDTCKNDYNWYLKKIRSLK